MSYQLPNSGLLISLSPCFPHSNVWRGREDIPVKAVSISHPEERYSASGVPRDEVSMLEASLVTELGTSLLCPLASISMKTYRKSVVTKKERKGYEEGEKEGDGNRHTAKNQILIPSLANSQTYTPPPPSANPAP
jgi:hypothetical protein